MTKRKKPNKRNTSYRGGSRLFKGLTPKRVEAIGHLLRSVVGGLIGLALTILFCTVIVSVMLTAASGDQTQGPQLISTALTITGSAFGAVLGYFLGRGARSDTK